MPPTDLAFLSIAELARLIRQRELSPTEVTRAAFERCEQFEPKINAFVTLLPEAALDEASRAEAEMARGEYRGALHGVPIAIKDLYWTRGVRTGAGSKIMLEFVPDETAAVVSRLRQAGAVVLGKTNMVEFAYGPLSSYHPEYGPTRNPWDLGRFPGSSSNGSGAAVAAGEVYGAMGSDTGGSIRGPASFCGISGLKPTYGLVSLYGAVPLSTSLDHAGPLARSAEDCAILLQAIAGHDPRDPASIQTEIPDYLAQLGETVSGLRLGLPRAFFWDDLASGIPEAIEGAADVFRRLGAEVVEIDLPNLAADALAAYTILKVEASAYHRRHLAERPDDFLPEVREKLDEGLQIPGVDYVEALEARRRLSQTFATAFGQVDAVLTPSRDTTAPRMDESGKLLDRFPHQVAGRASPSFPFNAAGLPAISIPCGFDGQGLPVGLHIAAPQLADGLVLRIAHAYQQATDWHTRRPRDFEEL